MIDDKLVVKPVLELQFLNYSLFYEPTNLAYEIIDYEPFKMTLRINFTNAEWISRSNYEQDLLSITFWREPSFVSLMKNKPVKLGSKLVLEIPKQTQKD